MKTFNLVIAVIVMTSSFNVKDFSHTDNNAPVLQEELCLAPTRQPVALEIIERSAHMVHAKFTSLETADNYLVLRSTQRRLSVLPQDCSRYSEGETLGEAVVVAYAPEEHFIAKNLQRNTTYYFFVIAVNDNCIKGPLYNTNTPLSKKVNTW